MKRAHTPGSAATRAWCVHGLGETSRREVDIWVIERNWWRGSNIRRLFPTPEKTLHDGARKFRATQRRALIGHTPFDRAPYQASVKVPMPPDRTSPNTAASFQSCKSSCYDVFTPMQSYVSPSTTSAHRTSSTTVKWRPHPRLNARFSLLRIRFLYDLKSTGPGILSNRPLPPPHKGSTWGYHTVLTSVMLCVPQGGVTA